MNEQKVDYRDPVEEMRDSDAVDRYTDLRDQLATAQQENAKLTAYLFDLREGELHPDGLEHDLKIIRDGGVFVDVVDEIRGHILVLNDEILTTNQALADMCCRAVDAEEKLASAQARIAELEAI